MARVTVEDCIDKVDDRFELVAVAAQRAKDIASGSPLTIERKGEKDAVVSLREVAAGKVDVSVLREEIVNNYQLEQSSDEEDFDESDEALEAEADVADEKQELKEDGLQEQSPDESAEISFEKDNLDIED